MKHKRNLPLLPAMLVLSVVPVIAITTRSASQTGREPPEGPVAVVQVVQAEARSQQRQLRVPGSVEGYFAADLYAKVSGYVAEVAVDIGGAVRKGEALLRIDVPETADELRQAEARVTARRAQVEAARSKVVQATLMIGSAEASARRAESELELQRVTSRRKEELYQGQAISDQDRDEAVQHLAIAEAQASIAAAAIESARGEKLAAEAGLQVAEADVAVADAEVARLRTLVEYASITAPFDGTITKRLVDPGAFVRSAAGGAGTPLLRLVRTDRLRLVLDIAQPDVPFVHAGTPVEVSIPALGGDSPPATVARTAGALEPATRTMRVEVDLENEDGRLLPGMYANAVISIVAGKQALMIPSAAVRSRGRETYVLVADGGVAKERVIILGRDDGIRAEVTSGLEGGEQVITSATSAVAHGVPVHPVPISESTTHPTG